MQIRKHEEGATDNGWQIEDAVTSQPLCQHSIPVINDGIHNYTTTGITILTGLAEGDPTICILCAKAGIRDWESEAEK